MGNTIKTKENDASVEAFIDSVASESKRRDSYALLEIYKEVTKVTPKMWGTSIIGFGKYHYKYERSNQEGDWPLTAFSPRKQYLTLYIMVPGFDYSELLTKLGKYKSGVACIYINKLQDVNLDVLRELIKQSYDDAKSLLVDSHKNN